MATPTFYKSNDASAPTLSGTAGALIGVLDGCLVSGYGSKAAAGWAKSFSGTNLAVYRAPSGVRHYLDVNDTAATTSGLRGYETMSGTGTGTGLFPTAAQAAANNITKSATADGIARPWMVVADDRTFYFFWNGSGTAFPPAGGTGTQVGFGEFLSVMASDNYRSMLHLATLTVSCSSLGAATTGGFFARNYTQLSAAASWFNAFGNATIAGNGGSTSALLGSATPNVFPNPADGGLYLSPIGLAERGIGTTIGGFAAIRGRYRGLWQIGHARQAFAEGDTFDGMGDYAGRSFYIAMLTTSGVASCVAIETTDWDANA